ncbi:MAG: hypothetical protein ACLTYN_15815 [Dysosmobacter welbionis]
MNPIYLRLFDGYAADILQKADPFDSNPWISWRTASPSPGTPACAFRTPFWPATSSGPPTPSPWDSTWAIPGPRQCPPWRPQQV